MWHSLDCPEAMGVTPIQIPRRTAEAAQLFMRHPQRRFLLGATSYAADIASHVPVQAILDDRCNLTDFNGIPIIRSDDLPDDAIVVATTLGRPASARSHLQSRGITHCDYFAFHRLCNLKLPHARFWTDFTSAAENNSERLQKIRQRLCDQDSLETFDAIVNFRLTANLDYLARFQDRQSEQYFEDFLGLRRDGETFADIGGFDGENSANFMARCPGFSAVHIFEPDPDNIQRIAQRLNPDNRVHTHPHGLSDTTGCLQFDSSGSVSMFSDTGAITATVRPLDDCSIGRVSFMKMDIEGGELKALQGARKTIATWKPRIAVCVYHRPDDFWTLPEEVLSIHNDYRVYLRHYTEGVVETVMFFIPPEFSNGC